MAGATGRSVVFWKTDCWCCEKKKSIFDFFFVCSKVNLHRFVQKNGPNLTSGRVFKLNFISKARARFLRPQTLLAEETKRKSLERPVLNLN